MIPRLHDIHYSRDLKAALICSLAIILSLFLFFPQINYHQGKIKIPEVIFSVENVPATIQNRSLEVQGQTHIEPPPIEIKTINMEPEILSDAEVEIISSNLSSNAIEGKTKGEENPGGSFTPRQIKEVLPRKSSEDIKGDIKLSLMIGKDGKVIKYILLSNSTKSEECLKNVLDAVHKSRWQTAKINGRETEYWVEKTYNFK